MPLNKKLRKRISDSFSKIQSHVEVLLFTSGKYPKVEDEMETALTEIVSLSPKISLKKFKINSAAAKKENVKKGPAIVLHGKEKGKVRFFGFPSGYQFPVFIMDILDVSGAKQGIKKRIPKGGIKVPKKRMQLEVFQMPPCSYSPIAMKMAHDIAILNKNVTADMVDALLFPELVRKYKIKEIPTTVINGKTKIVGVRPFPELLKILAKKK